MKCPYCIKICSKCGRLLVANNINFAKCKTGKYGLRTDCKECRNKNSKKCYEDNNRKEYFAKYRSENREICKERVKEWQKMHPEESKEISRKWQKENKERSNERVRKWQKNNPDKMFNQSQKRRLREENQGKGITKEQWLEMMEFFNWSCAYSNIQLNKNNRTIDHIVPLSKGGDHEIWNLIPMETHLNSSKNDKDWLEWYRKQDFYSKERLNKIYEWIEYAKNKWNN